jgi:prevent-host-death family protein
MTDSVGVRELRSNLSGCLKDVRKGRAFVITDRGTPIARLVPTAGETALERLLREGRISLPDAAKLAAPDPVRIGATVSDLVREQRR